MGALGWGWTRNFSAGRERRRSSGLLLLLGISALSAFSLSAQTPVPSSNSARSADTAGYAGDKVCERCHADIYRSYEKTAMARASGLANGNLIPGEFFHAASRVRYKIYEQDDRAWLSFDRDGADAIHGKRELLYFIGSGGRGRTYIFADSGFYFEAPVNWYAQKGGWDMTPAYQDAHHIPLNLPLASSCLSCHTSDPQSPAVGTENDYKEPLMTQEGIGCERCHGPGTAHAEKKGPIVNPAKLSPDRRDAVCMQCHLEGNVAIEQPDHKLNQFRPGDDLQDYVHYFVFAGTGRDFRAASQFEAFYQSKCKLKSGDSFSCITCHDPHYTPPASEKVAYYRAKCIACHGAGFAAKHHKKNPDCVSCHMPRIPSSDVAHTQATGHRILRRPERPFEVSGAETRNQPMLQRFPQTEAPADDRDLALAWESLAESGNGLAALQAQKHLAKALAENPDDPALLTATGFLDEKRGQMEKARFMYERALTKNPFSDVAATDLGVITAESGNLAQAIRLWKVVFAKEPEKSAVGTNLSKAFCAEGNAREAHATVERVLEFNPDLPQARELLRDLNRTPPDCELH
jgi:Tetratricopeptide repeat/Cytochrome c554 and c-prime